MNKRVSFGALRCLLALVGLFAATAIGRSESRWKMQYFFDQDKESLVIVDLKFSSPERGIAVGVVQQKHGIKSTALVTSDGGAHWTAVALPDEPRSLFLLNDAAGWLVGESGVWSSTEGGRNWKRILKNRRIAQVFFIDGEHGFAVGSNKTVLETKNGGLNWNELPDAKKPSTSDERTAYSLVYFSNPLKGLIIGRSSPVQRNERIPLWMDTFPESRPEVPAITIFLQTTDGGKTWSISQNTVFGSFTRFLLDPSGRGLGLIEYSGYGKVPSEVLRLDARQKSFDTVYKDPTRYITDVAIVNQGPAFAAGIEVRGKIATSPIPMKVKVLESLDMNTWTDMKVDYRATATRVHLGQSGANLWLATDTGMILKLVNE